MLNYKATRILSNFTWIYTPKLIENKILKFLNKFFY